MKTKTSYTLLYLCPIEWRYSMPNPDSLCGAIAISFKHSNFSVGLNTVLLKMDDTPITISGLDSRKSSKRYNNITTLKDIANALPIFGNSKSVFETNIAPFILVPKNTNNLGTFSSTIFQENTILFIRSGSSNSKPQNSLTGPLEVGLKAHHSNALPLNNHESYYIKYDSNNEIEYKLNLSTDTDIFKLGTNFLRTIKKNQFKNYTLQFLDNFNHWEFENHMFEVIKPKKERGYVSFIPCPNNKYIVKQKIYSEDQLKRLEYRKRDVILTQSMESYIERTYPNIASLKKLPSFTRRRYDVNIESLKTGNIFSIMFDQSTIKDSSKHPLIQCEIEYMKSRTVGKPIGVLEELRDVFDFTKKELGLLKIPFKETFYSKLSFLKDHVQA